MPLLDRKGLPCARRYENELAEAVRRVITEAELIQAVGRGRAVARSGSRPLQVFLICHDVAPMVVDEVCEFVGLEPGKGQEMLDRGFLPATPAHAVRPYPDLWETLEAARSAYRRGLGHLLMKKYL